MISLLPITNLGNLEMMNALRSDAKKEASRQRAAEYRRKRQDAYVVQGCTLVKTREIQGKNVRHSDKCPLPIFNPLGSSPPAQPMFVFDYVAWDVAAACPSLALPTTIAEMTEDMVAAVETYASRMIDAALAQVPTRRHSRQ